MSKDSSVRCGKCGARLCEWRGLSCGKSSDSSVRCGKCGARLYEWRELSVIF